MFENVSSLASHFLEDKSSEAWRKNNAAALQFIGVALLWDRLKSRCPQSFWIVGINRNEVFCVVCFLCPKCRNDFFFSSYFQDFSCRNNRNQNQTFKAVKCCLIKYVCLCLHSAPVFQRENDNSMHETTSTGFETLPPPCSSFHFFIIFEQAGKTWKVPFGFCTPRLDVRLLRPYKIEDDVAMETAGPSVTYGVPCR